MRLSYVLLMAVAALTATLDATSAASGTTLSKLSTANAVDPAENIGNDRRFLRKYEVVEDDDGEEEEERGYMDSAKAYAVMAKLALAQSTDEMATIISKVRDAGVRKALFINAESQLAKTFPSYKAGMSLDDFYTMVQRAGLSEDQQALMVSAYSKYLSAL